MKKTKLLVSAFILVIVGVFSILLLGCSNNSNKSETLSGKYYNYANFTTYNEEYLQFDENYGFIMHYSNGHEYTNGTYSIDGNTLTLVHKGMGTSAKTLTISPDRKTLQNGKGDTFNKE